MKKIILCSLGVILAFSLSAKCSLPLRTYDPNSTMSKNPETIRLTGQTKDESPDTKRTRSLIDPVMANIDYDMGQIGVEFTESIGQVSVYIINSAGIAVSNYTCNSGIEWLVYLPIPMDDGYYILKIITAQAEYSGEFTL